MILTFIMTGKFLEGQSTEKTKSAISALVSLTPDKCLILPSSWKSGDSLQDASEILVENVKLDSLLIVKPGQRIPLDGKIIFGKTTVDESMLPNKNYGT